MPVSDEHLTHVHVATAGTTSRKSHRGIRHGLHLHPEEVPAAHLIEVDGIPTVSATMAVATTALRLPLQDGLVLADFAAHARLTSAADLRRLALQLGRKVGNPTLRQVIANMDPNSESPGETRTRWTLVCAGYQVDSQVVINDSEGQFVARVDLKIRDSPVVVEFDGRSKFSMGGDTDETYWRWKLRLDAIRNAGYWPVVVTWRDLYEPGRIVAWVQRALADIAS